MATTEDVKMQLKGRTLGELQDLQLEIEREISVRVKGPNKQCYRVMTNGSADIATCCKKFKDAMDVFRDEASGIEDFGATVEISAIKVPEWDYDLRPDIWSGPR